MNFKVGEKLCTGRVLLKEGCLYHIPPQILYWALCKSTSILRARFCGVLQKDMVVGVVADK